MEDVCFVVLTARRFLPTVVLVLNFSCHFWSFSMPSKTLRNELENIIRTSFLTYA